MVDSCSQKRLAFQLQSPDENYCSLSFNLFSIEGRGVATQKKPKTTANFKIGTGFFRFFWVATPPPLEGGAHPKKPKKTSRYTKIGKLALVFFGFFWFFKISKLALVFFGFFFVFFGIGFGQNSKLETGFFLFFLGFFGFFFWFFLA